MIVALAVRLWRFAAGWFRALSHICRAPRPIAQAIPAPGVDTPGYRSHPALPCRVAHRAASPRHTAS